MSSQPTGGRQSQSRGRTRSPRLGPAQWTEAERAAANAGTNQGTVTDMKPDITDELDDDDDDIHWTLKTTIDSSKYMHLYRLPHKLSAANYVTWITLMESTLETVELYEYCVGKVSFSNPSSKLEARRWKRANNLVRAILTANMTEEVVNQLGHNKVASVIWSEARRLFAGQTTTDWTLTITNLVTTKFVEGEDLTAHIAKMKSYHCDLIMMQWDIDDALYACFLCISMPLT